MSLDFLDSLIARELGTASRVRPVPAFYGEALEEQAVRERDPVPSPPPSRPARREPPAEPSRDEPARSAGDVDAAEPPAPAVAGDHAAPQATTRRAKRAPAHGVEAADRDEASPAVDPGEDPAPPRERPVGAEPATPDIVSSRSPRPVVADAAPRTTAPPASRRAAHEPGVARSVDSGGLEAPPAPSPARAPGPPREAVVEAPRRLPVSSYRRASLSGALPAAVPTPAAEPAITVSIGRIEVRPPTTPVQRPAPTPSRPRTSLDDWLAQQDAR